jgi:uncharacterized membrane protein YkvA (DUF1232 family)
MKKNLDEQAAQEELEKGFEQAKYLLHNQDKIEKFLQRLEMKLKGIPVLGERLANIPVMASLIRSFVRKEYTDVPIGSIIAIISALVYFISPLDIVPDSIPVLGYIDDATVVAVCWKLVESDVKEYIIWRENKGMILTV